MLIHEVSERTGLSQATLRYYERIGVVDPVPRDENTGHRHYPDDVVQELFWLACLRATGMGVADLKLYRAQRDAGQGAEQRALLEHQAAKLQHQIEELQSRLAYLEIKGRLWGARAEGDQAAEQRAVAALNEWAVRS